MSNYFCDSNHFLRPDSPSIVISSLPSCPQPLYGREKMATFGTSDSL
jgi:hypothetical protein